MVTYYEQNKDKIRKQKQEYYIKNRSKIIEKVRVYRNLKKDLINFYNRKNSFRYKLSAKERIIQRKLTILNHYSKGTNKCICCNESIIDFLTIDHMNNDGAEHRRQIGSGTVMYNWLIKNNFPEGYQVMCMNCNWGRRVTGTCPHKVNNT